MISSSHEAEIQSLIYCEQRAGQYSDTFNPAGGRRLCVLVETVSKEGHLCLFDLTPAANLGTHNYSIVIVWRKAHSQ